MTEAQSAHLRLMERLRDRVRTHQRRQFLEVQRGRKYTADEKAVLRARLLEMARTGMDRKSMAAEIGTTNKTIVRLLGNARRRGRHGHRNRSR